MFKQIFKMSLLSILLFSGVLEAGVVVIVHPSVDIGVSSTDVSSLFLGKSKNVGGVKLIPVDQEEGAEAREYFYQSVANKSPSQLNAYWARIVFTGKGQPPKALMDDSEVIDWVSSNSEAIGYISTEEVTDSVKVVLTVN